MVASVRRVPSLVKTAVSAGFAVVVLTVLCVAFSCFFGAFLLICRDDRTLAEYL